MMGRIAANRVPVLMLIGLLLACTAETPETRVRAFLSEVEEAAEERDLFRLRDMISEQYADNDQRDRRAVLRLAGSYFIRNRSIFVLTKIEDITFLTQERARVTLLAALAAKPLEDNASLLAIRADIYRFDLQLVEEDGDWHLFGAAWQPAARADFGS